MDATDNWMCGIADYPRGDKGMKAVRIVKLGVRAERRGNMWLNTLWTIAVIAIIPCLGHFALDLVGHIMDSMGFGR